VRSDPFALRYARGIVYAMYGRSVLNMYSSSGLITFLSPRVWPCGWEWYMNAARIEELSCLMGSENERGRWNCASLSKKGKRKVQP
jgi:hypothetical protein